MADSKKNESKQRAIKTLVGCIIVVGIAYGNLSVLSNYFVVLCERLNASSTEVSLMFSIIMAFSCIMGFVVAAVIEKRSIRSLMLLGVVCYFVFFACLLFAQDIIVVYIGSAFYGTCIVLIGFTVAQTAITYWHVKNLGKKISSLSIAMSVSAMILSPILATMLSTVGFEITVLFHGGLLGIVILVAVIVLVSNKPASYGLEPYGVEEILGSGAQDQAYQPSGLTAKQAMRTYSFWAIAVGVILLMVFANGFTVMQSPIFQSCGFDLIESSALISVFSGFSVLWVFIYGVITDKIGPRLANIIFTVATIIVLVLFVLIGGKAGGIFLAITAGIGTTYSGVLASVTYTSLFGSRGIGTLISVSLATSGIGSMVAAPFANMINVLTGTFTGYLGISAVLLVIVLILFATATSKRSVQKIKAMECANAASPEQASK